jgi:YD repeat-containing protein
MTATTFTYAATVTTTRVGQVSCKTYDYEPGLQGGAQYGNLTTERDYGDASVSGDEKTIYRRYVPATNGRWIVNALGRESVYRGILTSEPGTAERLLSRTRYRYDGASCWTTVPVAGQPTAVEQWVEGRGGTSANCYLPDYDVTQTSYDAWGNPTTRTDALGRVTRAYYDPTYHLYPVAAADALGQTSWTGYELGLGLPLTMTGASGTSSYYRYDTFGRLTAEIRPGDSESLPTRRYQDPWGLKR